MLCEDAQVPLVGSRLQDLADLVDDETELVVGGVVVRPRPDARLRAEVAEDLPLGQLAVHGREARDVDGHGPAASLGRARSPRGRVGEVDQEAVVGGGADPFDTDLLDQVVAGGRRVVGGHVRGAGEEPRRPDAGISSSKPKGTSCACHPVKVGVNRSARSGRT